MEEVTNCFMRPSILQQYTMSLWCELYHKLMSLSYSTCLHELEELVFDQIQPLTHGGGGVNYQHNLGREERGGEGRRGRRGEEREGGRREEEGEGGRRGREEEGEGGREERGGEGGREEEREGGREEEREGGRGEEREGGGRGGR